MIRRVYIYLSFATLLIPAISGCKKEIVDCGVTGPVLAITHKDSDCNQSNGYILVTASGVEPFRYSLDGGLFQDKNKFNNLSPGFYHIAVVDKNGCENEMDQEIMQVNSFDIVVSSTPSGCNTADGTLNLYVSGGIPPYFYSFDGALFQSQDTYQNLSAGVYSVTIKDSQNCQTTVSHQVLSGVSWVKNIEPVFQAHCSINSCHLPGGQGIDLTNLATVQKYAENIKTSVENKSMPPSLEPPLSQVDINLITCWIDDGAKNN